MADKDVGLGWSADQSGVETVTLTEEELRRRNRRSIGIAAGLLALVALFFVATLIKFSSVVQQAGS